MKALLRVSLAIFAISILFSCGQSPSNQSQQGQGARLEVIYFHTSMRCSSCLAIEKGTKKVLDDYFSEQLRNGIIKFTSTNIEKKASQDLVEKYKVSFLTLLLIKADGTKTDFTETAIRYAETSPEKYIELLRAEIDNNLR